MTTKKHLKRRVRARANQTGEPYATALRKVREQREDRMGRATTSARDVIASCSFCGKPNTAVQRLVAGPGVYICDECIELAAWVVEDAALTRSEEASRRGPEFWDRPTDDILAMVPALVHSADRVEGELAFWISRLRDRRVDWQTIADAAGMTAHLVRRRFGPKDS